MAEATIAPGRALGIDVAAEIARARLEAILFCDRAEQTPEGKMTLVGILDRMLVAREQPQIAAVDVFIRVAGHVDQPLHLSITAPDGACAGDVQFQAPPGRSEMEGSRIQLLARVRFSVSEFGSYWFSIHSGSETIGGSALSVEALGADAKKPASPPAPATITSGDAELIETHPLAAVGGKFEGEEWEGLLEAIRQNRQELNETELDA